MIDHIFAIDFTILASALIKKQKYLAIDQNLLIDRKVENTFNLSIDHQFFNQLNFSNFIIANFIILSNINADKETVIDSK